MAGWDLTNLSTIEYVTNEYTISEEVRNVRVDSKTTNVVLIPTEEETVQVVCREQEKVKHSVAVEDGTLIIATEDTRAWYDHIGINLSIPRIAVYLPEKEYGLISVQSSTGDVKCYVSAAQIQVNATTGNIFVENISVGTMELRVSTGVITVMDVTDANEIKLDSSTGRVHGMNIQCESFSTEGSTGDVILEQVIARSRLSVQRNTGDVKLDYCDAGQLIRVETNTGDVRGCLVSGKNFTAVTGTGNIDVPESTDGGECWISTNTGDIRIVIDEE